MKIFTSFFFFNESLKLILNFSFRAPLLQMERINRHNRFCIQHTAYRPPSHRTISIPTYRRDILRTYPRQRIRPTRHHLAINSTTRTRGRVGSTSSWRRSSTSSRRAIAYHREKTSWTVFGEVKRRKGWTASARPRTAKRVVVFKMKRILFKSLRTCYHPSRLRR